jgi:hypothetical protein
MSTHNILFYSSHPNDKLSQEILAVLTKNPLLKDQFATVCVNTPGIKLPKMIVERNEVPVIVTRGFNQPISGQAALNLILEHSNSDKALGLEFGDVNKASQVSEDHGILANESGRTSYHQAFNDEWNAGAENDVRTVNTSFSSIDDKTSVETFAELGKEKNLQQNMKLRDRNRRQDVQGLNDPNRRADNSFTLQQLNNGSRTSGPGSLRGGTDNGLMYNPYPMGQPTTPDLPPGLRPMETNPGRDSEGRVGGLAPPQFTDYSRSMTGGGGGPGMGRGMMSGGGMGGPGIRPGMGGGPGMMGPGMSRGVPGGIGRGGGGNDFMPPQSNPLFPPSRAGGGGPNMGDFPALPPGFGGVGGGGGGGAGGAGAFSALDSAFTGQSLMGTPMKATTQRGNNTINDRREKSFGPGLPVGRGVAGPMPQY